MYSGKLNNIDVIIEPLIFKGGYDPEDNRRWFLILKSKEFEDFHLFPNPYRSVHKDFLEQSIDNYVRKLGFIKVI